MPAYLSSEDIFLKKYQKKYRAKLGHRDTYGYYLEKIVNMHQGE